MSKRDNSLTWVFIVGLGIIISGGIGLLIALNHAPTINYAGVFQTLATVSGLVGGLSLAATTIIDLRTERIKNLVAEFGSHIKIMIFGGYSLTILIALMCTIAPIWSEELWVKILLAFSVPTLFVVLVLTALLVNNLMFLSSNKKRNKTPRNQYI